MFDEGLYKARATSWGFAETTNGHEQFVMRFDIIGMLDKSDPDGEPEACDPGSGWWSITLKDDKNVEWLISNVQHLGYDRDDLLRLDPDADDAFDFESAEFVASCKHEDYQGKTRAKWSVYRPGGASKPLSQERLLSLNDRFGHLVSAVRERHEAKAAEAQPAERPKGAVAPKVVAGKPTATQKVMASSGKALTGATKGTAGAGAKAGVTRKALPF